VRVFAPFDADTRRKAGCRTARRPQCLAAPEAGADRGEKYDRVASNGAVSTSRCTPSGGPVCAGVVPAPDAVHLHEPEMR
jgi:hypothetical protein